MLDFNYWNDVAANRAAFSDSDLIRPELSDIWYDCLVEQGNDLLILGVFDYLYQFHYDHFVNECNNNELYHGIYVFTGNIHYPGINGLTRQENNLLDWSIEHYYN